MISYVESHKEASHVLVYLWVSWTFCAVFLFYRNQILYVNRHSIAVHMNSVILSKSESCCSTELTARSRCSVMFVLLLNWGPEKKKVYTSASTSTLSLFSADTWKTASLSSSHKCSIHWCTNEQLCEIQMRRVCAACFTKCFILLSVHSLPMIKPVYVCSNNHWMQIHSNLFTTSPTAVV